MDELEKYLLGLGVSKVGYADVNGLAKDFVDLPYGISLVLKLPKETIKLALYIHFIHIQNCFFLRIR